MRRMPLRHRLIEAFHETACLSTPCMLTCEHRAHVALRTAAPELTMAQRAADVHAALRARNREYGKASRTIAAVRGELARERERRRQAEQMTHAMVTDREILAVILNLPKNASTQDMRTRAMQLAAKVFGQGSG